jgi:hypothetical protein
MLVGGPRTDRKDSEPKGRDSSSRPGASRRDRSGIVVGDPRGLQRFMFRIEPSPHLTSPTTSTDRAASVPDCKKVTYLTLLQRLESVDELLLH